MQWFSPDFLRFPKVFMKISKGEVSPSPTKTSIGKWPASTCQWFSVVPGPLIVEETMVSKVGGHGHQQAIQSENTQ